MYENENAEVAKIAKWIHDDRTLWELVYEEDTGYWTNKDVIDILRKMLDQELFQLAMVLIAKLDHNDEMHEAIENAIVSLIKVPMENKGILTECINEMENVVKRNNTMKKRIII